jgi:hypothetical protein
MSKVEHMATEGVPTKIDTHFLIGMSGGTQNHFRHALRSLGLIDGDSRPTQLLHDVVAARGDDRAKLVATIYGDRFPDLMALPDNASKSDFITILADKYGVKSSDQQRKVLSFFAALCDEAGIPLSAYIKPSKSHTGPRGPRRTGTRRTRKPGGGGTDEAARAEDGTKGAGLSDDAMRGMYFRLLLDKAQKADDDSDLLDRIERLVGVSTGEDQQRKPAGSTQAPPAS